MPLLAGDALGILVKILFADGRMVRNDGRCGAVAADMDMRFAEIADEALVRFEINLLVAEEDDAVGDDGVVHLLDRPVRQRAGEVDIADLGPDMRRRRGDGYGLVGHGFFSHGRNSWFRRGLTQAISIRTQSEEPDKTGIHAGHLYRPDSTAQSGAAGADVRRQRCAVPAAGSELGCGTRHLGNDGVRGARRRRTARTVPYGAAAH